MRLKFISVSIVADAIIVSLILLNHVCSKVNQILIRLKISLLNELCLLILATLSSNTFFVCSESRQRKFCKLRKEDSFRLINLSFGI